MHYWHVYRAEAETDKINLNAEESKSLKWYSIDELKRLNLEPVWKYWLEKFGIINPEPGSELKETKWKIK